jgi:hypothetical protein
MLSEVVKTLPMNDRMWPTVTTSKGKHALIRNIQVSKIPSTILENKYFIYASPREILLRKSSLTYELALPDTPVTVIGSPCQ